MLLLLNVLLLGFVFFFVLDYYSFYLASKQKKYSHLESIYVVQCLLLTSWKAIDSKNKACNLLTD